MLVIGALFLPFDFADLADVLLRHRQALSLADFERYLAIMPFYYVVDSILILGWIVAWVGMASYVCASQALLGRVALVVGLCGPLCDFLENGIAWGLMEASQEISVAVPGGWLLAWRLARFLSYVMAFAGAALAAGPLWNDRLLDRWVALWSSALLLVALAGFYFPALSLAGLFWWFGWFVGMGILLWRRAAEVPPAK